jgi:Golgi nucleoside diphosphatase
MTTINGAKVAIANYFVANWTNTSVKYVFDNTDSNLKDGNSSWIWINMQLATGEQASLGSTSRRFRRYGFLTFSVFTLTGTATEINDNICQAILNLFDGKHVSNIWFRDGGAKFVGTDAKWFQQNVQYNFIFDEIK